jgi:hypothetical protein
VKRTERYRGGRQSEERMGNEAGKREEKELQQTHTQKRISILFQGGRLRVLRVGDHKGIGTYLLHHGRIPVSVRRIDRLTLTAHHQTSYIDAQNEERRSRRMKTQKTRRERVSESSKSRSTTFKRERKRERERGSVTQKKNEERKCDNSVAMRQERECVCVCRRPEGQERYGAGR